MAFLVLYGIALATEGWGVVASLKIYPPFAGASVSAITLVVSFGFAFSRPCLTLKVGLCTFKFFISYLFILQSRSETIICLMTGEDAYLDLYKMTFLNAFQILSLSHVLFFLTGCSFLCLDDGRCCTLS